MMDFACRFHLFGPFHLGPERSVVTHHTDFEEDECV